MGPRVHAGRNEDKAKGWEVVRAGVQSSTLIVLRPPLESTMVTSGLGNAPSPTMATQGQARTIGDRSALFEKISAHPPLTLSPQRT